MKHSSLAILLFLIFIPAQRLHAQVGMDLLNAGKDFEKNGRFDDAVRGYQQVIDSPSSATEVKLEATFRLGRIQLEVRGDVAKAQQYFAEVKKGLQFPDLVALGMVYNGKAIMATAKSETEYSRALSEFDTVIRAYPNSPAFVEALVAGGSVLEVQHKFEDARVKYQSIVFGFPNAPVAPNAFMSLGRTLTRLESVDDALKDYQNVQRLYGDRPVAAIAKQNATLLYRVFNLHDRTQAQVARKSDAFKLDSPEKIDWLASGGIQIFDGTHTFAVSTKGEVSPAATPADFTDSKKGGAYRISKKAILLPDSKTLTPVLKKDGKPSQFGEILCGAVNHFGDLVIATSGPDGVFRVTRETGDSVAFLPGAKKAKKILADSEDNFYILDDNQSTITVVDWQGKSLASVLATTAGVKRIQDFTLDTFDNLYVLDEEGQYLILGGVSLSKNKLKPLQKQQVVEKNDKASDKPNAPPKLLKELRAIAVSPTGSVYIAAKDQLLSFE